MEDMNAKIREACDRYHRAKNYDEKIEAYIDVHILSGQVKMRSELCKINTKYITSKYETYKELLRICTLGGLLNK